MPVKRSSNGGWRHVSHDQLRKEEAEEEARRLKDVKDQQKSLSRGENHRKRITILVLGIVSVFCVGVFGSGKPNQPTVQVKEHVGGDFVATKTITMYDNEKNEEEKTMNEEEENKKHEGEEEENEEEEEELKNKKDSQNQIFAGYRNSTEEEEEEEKVKEENPITEDLLRMMKKYEDCTVPTQSAPTEEDKLKAIWFPSYPYAFDDKILNRLGNLLTGLKMGTKSFHKRSNKLKNCKGMGPTAICTQIHPFMNAKPLDLTGQFAPSIVLGMRNPLTALPAHHNAKQILYHGVKGQEPIDTYREWRERRTIPALGLWTNQIEAWQQAKPSYYQIDLYFAYEHLMDYQTGPETVRKLAKVLQKSGFDTPNVDDNNVATCIWYRGVGKDAIMNHAQYKYEYSDYFPLFLAEQHQAMQNTFENLIEKNKNNETSEELLNILDLYMMQVKQAEIDPVGNTTFI